MAKKAAAPVTEAQMDAETEQIGNTLRRNAKVRIKIPFDPQNKADKVVPVVVNGHMYRINRGETVEVPEVVAEILEQSGLI